MLGAGVGRVAEMALPEIAFSRCFGWAGAFCVSRVFILSNNLGKGVI